LCVLRELDYGGLVHEASRYFDIAFDQAPIGMAIFNADGEYVRVNPALCELLGRGDDQLLGRRDQEFTHPDDRQLDVDVAWDILAGRRSTFQRQKRFVRPDGAVVWAIANLTFLRDERGRPLNWVGQFQDITALRHTPAPE
jgi:PAS domain S-box-containing protein